MSIGASSIIESFTPARASGIGLQLQCVPFARSLSSIDLYGDAELWWSEAAGRYDRGHVPQVGSILSFRPDVRMPRGHLAVVTDVIGPRKIEIDHANWSSPGAISRGVQVLDVSEMNDWSVVRVELSRRDYFGSVYTTDGFIYDGSNGMRPRAISLAEMLRTASSGPRTINVAEALSRAGKRGEIINVAEALSAGHIINVAEALRVSQYGSHFTKFAEFRRSKSSPSGWAAYRTAGDKIQGTVP